MGKVILITDEAEGKAAYRRLRASSGPVAYDLEATGLQAKTCPILLMQFATADGYCCMLPLYGPYREMGLALAPHFARLIATRLVLAHNGRYEYEMTREQLGVELTNIGDTYLRESVLTAGRNVDLGLGGSLKRRCRIALDKDLQKSWIGVDPNTFDASAEQLSYAANDVLYMHRLYNAQGDKLIDEQTQQIAELECAAIPAFAAMERNGLYLDTTEHGAVVDEYATEQERAGTQAVSLLGAAWSVLESRRNTALERVYTERCAVVAQTVSRARKNAPEGAVVAGTPAAKKLYQWRDKVKPGSRAFSLGSQDMVKQAFRVLGIDRRTLPDIKKNTVRPLLVTLPEGQAKAALQAYADWKRCQKVTSTYGYSMSAKIQEDKRLHPHYTQMVSTGRVSSSNPNGQNMPPRIRHCFKPESGKVFVVADFAAMELRILAGMSGDPNMLEAFARGWDLHRVTAANAWPELYKSWEDVPHKGEHRAHGKTGNFGFIYGGSPMGMYMRGVMPSLAIGERIHAGYVKSYPVAWEWIQSIGRLGVARGYAVTQAGRKRYFIPVGREPKYGTEAHQLWRKAYNRTRRQAQNHPVQGTGADIMKLAMIDLHGEFLHMPAKLVACVHDELLVECDEDIATTVADMVHSAMANAGKQLFDNVVMDADVHIVRCWEKD